MPTPPRSAAKFQRRLSAAAGLGAAIASACLLMLPAAASASHSQLQMIQDGTRLQEDPATTLAQFRGLGAKAVRVVMFWYYIAPDAASTTKPSFDATDPNAYPASGWAPYDAIVRDAKKYGITVDFTVAGGAPRWAEGAGAPKDWQNDGHFAWEPNATDYKQFMQAVGKRYSGSFTPSGGSKLPRVSMWALWNEPNFGQDLGPQATDNSKVSYAPQMYRGLVNAGWSALHSTGHGSDKILIGEFAARGDVYHKPTGKLPQGLPGFGGQTRPLAFIRTLYCVDAKNRKLTGKAAKTVGCPTTASASAKFRSQNPGLFNASAVGDHPYPDHGSPVTDGRETDYAAFPDLGKLETQLDKVNAVYGSHKKYSIYNDEYGYITNPPSGKPYVSQATSATYLNWAEYLSWKEPRTASTMQYLLEDPSPTQKPYNGFSSGLYTYNGKPKAALNAYRLPFYLPKTSFSKKTSAELWGEARPGNFTHGQKVAVQFQAGGHGAWKTVATDKAGGYFDTHLKFGSSGNVRLAYTYPKTDAFVPMSVLGTTIVSRTQKISVH